MSRVRIYLMPFQESGEYQADWLDVSDDVDKNSLGSIRRTLENSDFDLGLLTNSSFSLTLRNDHGKFSEVGEVNSIFLYKRSDTRVKITWDFADEPFHSYNTSPFSPVGDETMVFEGLLSDESSTMGMRDQTINFDVLGYEAILDRIQTPDWVGTPPASNFVSELLNSLLSAVIASPLASPLFVNDLGFIDPFEDPEFDDLTVFENKTARESLAMLLNASNSIIFIDAGIFKVQGRVASEAIVANFNGQGSDRGPENIIDLKEIRSGLNRTFNFFTWRATALFSSDVSSISRLGIRKKEIAIDGITTGATQQLILDSYRTEFANQKQELILETPITQALLALKPLDQVSLDVPHVSTQIEQLATYEISRYGTAVYPTVISAFQVLPTDTFKVLGLEFNLKTDSLILKLRRI